MNRGLILLAALLMLVPSSAAQSEAMPGEYPEPIEEALGDVLDEAEADGAPQDAQRFLEQARTEFDAGNLSMAIENFVRYRLAEEKHELADELRDMDAAEGEERADRHMQRTVREGRASAELAREHLNDIELRDLTQQGLDTALWGAVLVARGEMSLNVHDTQAPPNVYEAGKLQMGDLDSRLGAALGGTLYVQLGLEIASRASQVPGEDLDPETAHERLSQVANRSVPTKASSPPEYLPEGSPDESALVRTALLHVSMVELRLPEFERAFGRGESPRILAQMGDALEFDRRQLGPYAEQGFPFAKASFEGVAYRSLDQLQDPARDPPQRAHAVAFATSEIEKGLFPNATDEAESQAPGVGLAAAAAGLITAAMVACRTRR